MVNILLILANFFIHKAKFIKTPPIFTCYNNEIQLYTKSLKLMESKHAKDLYVLLENNLTNEAP